MDLAINRATPAENNPQPWQAETQHPLVRLFEKDSPSDTASSSSSRNPILSPFFRPDSGGSTPSTLQPGLPSPAPPVIDYETTLSSTSMTPPSNSSATPSSGNTIAAPSHQLPPSSGSPSPAAAAPVPLRPTTPLSTLSSSSYERATPPPSSLSPGEVLAIPPPMANKLVPGSHGRSPTQYAVSNRMIPLALDADTKDEDDHSLPTSNRSSPGHPSCPEAQNMSRARSMSEQSSRFLAEHPPPPPPTSLDDQRLLVLPTSDPHRHKSVASSHQPLARRVRSATTLRQSEEDRVPLKTLVANKQRHHHQQQLHRLQPLTPSKPSLNQHRQKRLVEHRRSISADNVEQAQIMLQQKIDATRREVSSTGPSVPPPLLDGSLALQEQLEAAVSDLSLWLGRLNNSLKHFQG
ncbi:hypothetical protein DM01DRAFT_1218734 [Hesseltinella vesiculosa]|uniref:Uncharacterized protein n=1 Tax=Hesseltinella vesiculosa TaxID=101127 RepID=A0A1X2GQ61_9FUNG|nr:hypothetical protein DM01DRAFT_1218734 [Hesseltinella vesiculosa]